jgi:hypothetical protein
MSQNKNSQYDPGLIVKEVHDFYGQYIRVRDTNSLNSQHFTHFSATYDVNNNPTEITYFRGITSHVTSIGCVDDVASSLNNKYFSIRACPSNQKYHIWFNVGGAGVAPVVADSTPIEIDISEGDPAVVVATAIKLTLNLLYSKIFTVTQLNAVLEIRTVGFGICSNTVDINTGFAISNTAGTQVVTDVVSLTYSGNDPIYNGQVLKNYRYNIWGGFFEPSSSTSISITAPVISSGTDDGTPSGTPYVFVNNEFSQILAAGDRVDEFIYADAGTKNERVIEINTTSTNVHPGKTAKKSIIYTLVGNSYVLASITKSVI